MSELFFLRHGLRIDHALQEDPEAQPLLADSQPYDPSLSTVAVGQMEKACDDLLETTEAFQDKSDTSIRKNIFIHVSPYLRCLQSADLMITFLKNKISSKYPNYKVRIQILGDFALSEWIHDKMKNKPPFIDSNDAYQMYTPNIKTLKNKNCVSNFRPTNSLGPFNGPDLNYKDYQNHCKSYFKKLLATYDKPSYIKNKDIILIISHGYVINNFVSYFINHPIFDEIPGAKINYAKRVKNDEINEDSDEYDPSNYKWVLFKDSLDLFTPDIDTSLNLETDIVYYKTNFIKRDELNDQGPQTSKSPGGFLGKPQLEKPRPSFKIPQTSNQHNAVSSTKENHNNPAIIKNYNPICPAAKDWEPDLSLQFKIKSEFQLKVINDEAFKKSFNITNRPVKPISPEVSPNSKPTRNNSVIDLSKLVDNDDIYKPMKLKYSTTSQIPIHKLNSKVNSQVNLAQYQRSNNSSNDNSLTDLPKYLNSIQKRRRSSSNPINVTVAHNAKDSYFPLNIISKVRSTPDKSSDFHTSTSQESLSPNDDGGVSDLNSDLDIIQETHGGPTTPGAFDVNLFNFETPSSTQSPEPSELNSGEVSGNLGAAVAAGKRPVPTPQQPPNPLLNRSKSLNYKRGTAPASSKSLSLLAKYQQHQQSQQSQQSKNKNSKNSEDDDNDEDDGEDDDEEDDDDNINNRMFSLSFANNRKVMSKNKSPKSFDQSSFNGEHKNPVKFYPSGISNNRPGTPPSTYSALISTTPVAFDKQNRFSSERKVRPMFYQFGSNSNSNEDLSTSESPANPHNPNEADDESGDSLSSDDSISSDDDDVMFNNRDKNKVNQVPTQKTAKSKADKKNSQYIWFGQNRS